jgi:hypothetical protein
MTQASEARRQRRQRHKMPRDVRKLIELMAREDFHVRQPLDEELTLSEDEYVLAMIEAVQEGRIILKVLEGPDGEPDACRFEATDKGMMDGFEMSPDEAVELVLRHGVSVEMEAGGSPREEHHDMLRAMLERGVIKIISNDGQPSIQPTEKGLRDMPGFFERVQ